jgi:hypothetical protein
MVMVDDNIPVAEKLKYLQTIVSAVKTKGNLNSMVMKAKVYSEGVRMDIERDEKHPAFAPPTSGPIQINVHQGGKVEVSEKEKAV